MHEVPQKPESLSHTSFIARYFSDIRTIALIVMTLVGAGIVTFFSLPKELNPSIKIPIVTVVTAYPGASPQDVKELITVPVEDAVSGLEGATKTNSTSQEGLSVVTIEFTSATNPDQAKQDVQSEVDTIPNVPVDAGESAVQVIDFQNQPVLNFMLTGTVDNQTLRLAGEEITEAVKSLNSVEKILVSYDTPLEIVITLDYSKTLAQTINPTVLGETLQKVLSNTPGGSLSTQGNTFAFGVDRSAYTLDDIRDLPIVLNSNTYRLGNVATVAEQPAPNNEESWYANKNTAVQKSILFSVYKTNSANASDAVAEIQKATDNINQKYGNVLTVASVFDGAKEIKKSFDQLFKDFFLTVGLVFIILILFFGLRQSIVSSLAIPLTFLITFIIMGIVGISINFIALFSLLLALGILVDNVIVIISAMASYERLGHHTPAQSALLVWRDFKSVIFTTTITTIWAFLPLLLASGIIGEFIKPIPIVVSSALAVSALVALFVVIPVMATLQTGEFAKRVLIFGKVLLFLLGASVFLILMPSGPYKIIFLLLALFLLGLLFWQHALLKQKKYNLGAKQSLLLKKWHSVADNGVFDLHPLSKRYEAFIRSILLSKRKRKRTIIALIIFSLFSYTLVPLGFVINEFFPEDDQETIFVSVTLPKGTASSKARAEAETFLEELRALPDTRFVTAEVGAGLPNDSGINSGENNDLLFTILLVSKKERDISSGEFVKNLNTRYQDLYPNGEFSASQLSGGPPAGSDLQIKFLGEDLNILNEYGQKVEAYLKQEAGVSQVKSSLQTGSGKIIFIPNQQALTSAGVAEQTVAYFVRTLGSGITLVEDARFNDQKRDVVLRLTNKELATPADAASLLIPTPSGPKMLSSLGSFELTTNPTEISREDGKQTLSVSAGVSSEFSVSQKSKDLEKFAGTLDLPAGYSWKIGGVNEENDKSVQSILKAMLLSAVLIFATMTIQFRSFRKSIIVLMVIPLAVSGVFIVFALTGTPLSFPALIGILALFGIVVNNSIIMVDKINRNMDQGLPLIDAIAEGASSRMEPILLTALTTIVGLIPITLSDPIWQGLGGAIIAGLLFSGLAKLFMIPVLYWLFYGEKTAE